jgi:hypothetical protein
MSLKGILSLVLLNTSPTDVFRRAWQGLLTEKGAVFGGPPIWAALRTFACSLFRQIKILVEALFLLQFGVFLQEEFKLTLYQETKYKLERNILIEYQM